MREGDDVELAAFAGPVVPDANAQGRPPLARVERIVRVSGTVWLHVRHLDYHAAPHGPSQCAMVELTNAAADARVVPIDALWATALLTHACLDIVDPDDAAVAAAAAPLGGGGVLCTWEAGTEEGRAFGRMRELKHAHETRRVYFVNRFLR